MTFLLSEDVRPLLQRFARWKIVEPYSEKQWADGAPVKRASTRAGLGAIVD
jgi:hypothetical protein